MSKVKNQVLILGIQIVSFKHIWNFEHDLNVHIKVDLLIHSYSHYALITLGLNVDMHIQVDFFNPCSIKLFVHYIDIY